MLVSHSQTFTCTGSTAYTWPQLTPNNDINPANDDGQIRLLNGHLLQLAQPMQMPAQNM